MMRLILLMLKYFAIDFICFIYVYRNLTIGNAPNIAVCNITFIFNCFRYWFKFHSYIVSFFIHSFLLSSFLLFLKPTIHSLLTNAFITLLPIVFISFRFLLHNFTNFIKLSKEKLFLLHFCSLFYVSNFSRYTCIGVPWILLHSLIVFFFSSQFQWENSFFYIKMCFMC